jgi:anti-repressor protein
MEIIKIETKDGIETCNSRDLWSFLQPKTRHNDWIKNRIEKYNFKENIDYILLTEKLVSGNNADCKMYYISIEMAKELSMVENNDKGKIARQYFIECEKKIKTPENQIIQQFSQAINLFTKTLETMDKRLTNIENVQSKQIETTNPVKQKYTVRQYITKNNIKSYNMNLFSNQVGRALTKLSRDLHRGIGFIREGDYDVGLYDEDLFETAVIVATKMIEKNNTLF